MDSPRQQMASLAVERVGKGLWIGVVERMLVQNGATLDHS